MLRRREVLDTIPKVLLIMEGWLVIDGYEDEPAAFGVPNYLGFHIRYICGVLESRKVPYTYMTIDQWRDSLEPPQTRRNESILKLAGSFAMCLVIDGQTIMIVCAALLGGDAILKTRWEFHNLFCH